MLRVINITNGTSRWLIYAATVLLFPAIAHAQPSNPGLDDTDTNELFVGWTDQGTVRRHVATDGNAYAIFQEEALAGGVPGAGFARLFQGGVTLPASSYLTFRYRMISNGGTRRIDLPPDAFVVRLYKNAGSTSGDHFPTDEPDFTEAVFYHSTDRGTLFHGDGDLVQITPPDAEGFTSVAIRADAAGFPQASLTVEFGFVYSDNGEEVAVHLDGVAAGCPAGYCCSNDLLVMNVLDDGLPCTDTCCETLQNEGCACAFTPSADCTYTGNVVVTFTDPCCPRCRDEVNANVIIMIDMTSSISNADLDDEKEAAIAFLDAFEAVSPRPWVAIGTFRVPLSGGGAPAVVHTALTTNYTTLRSTINNLTQPGGYTNIGAAIDVAQATLSSIGSNDDNYGFPNYIVLISDGEANRPTTYPSGYTCVFAPENQDCNTTINDQGVPCVSPPSWCTAAYEAEQAKSTGTTIVAVFNDGHATNCTACCGGCAIRLMRDIIATEWFGAGDNPYFIDASSGTADLICGFYKVVEIISCNGGVCQDGVCVDP